MWLANRTCEQISERLDRRTSAIAVKSSRLDLPRRNRYDHRPKAGIRRRLRCRRDFHSFGPSNQICAPCKGTTEYRGLVEHKCDYLP